MVKSLLVHFPEIGRLKDEGENTPLNLFVCKSVMKGVSWGLLFLWLGVITCCLFACQQKEEEVRLTFEDGIAQALQTGKKLLVWHAWENGIDTTDYFEKIKKEFESDSLFRQNYILVHHVANIVGNEALSRILQNNKQPLWLLFSADLNLEMVWPGAKKELKQRLDSVSKGFALTETYTNTLHLSDEDYKKVVSSTLKAFWACKEGDEGKAFDMIRYSVQIAPYFYNSYLAAKIYERNGKQKEAEEQAQSALQSYDESDYFLYHALCDELYFILGCNAPTGGEQRHIVFRETMKDCGRIGYRTKCEIDYEFKNIGSVPVLIKQVVKSCNCMEVSWDTQPVLPGATGHIHVVHKADRKGNFSKMIAVFLHPDSPKIFLSYKGRVY